MMLPNIVKNEEPRRDFEVICLRRMPVGDGGRFQRRAPRQLGAKGASCKMRVLVRGQPSRLILGDDMEEDEQV